MSKTLSLIATLMLTLSLHAQTLFTEGFDEGIPSTWTMFNDNNTPFYSQWNNQAWIILSSEQSGNPAPGAAGLSFFSPSAHADRWLITPAISIPADMEPLLLFDAKTPQAPYPEWLEVRICTTTPNSRDDFGEPVVRDTAVPASWTEYNCSLAAYAGQTIYIAFIVKSDGYYLLVDNVFVGALAQHEVVLSSLDLPAFAGLDNDIPVSGTVTNRGQAHLTAFDVAYILDGSDTVEATISGIDIPFNGTYHFTAPTPASFATPGDHSIQVVVSRPNGVADSTADNTLSTTVNIFNSDVVGERTVLIEQFTGDQCGYCPIGHDRIEQALTMTGIRHQWVMHHAGFNIDDLSNDNSLEMTWFFNEPSTYAPAMMIDRTNTSRGYPGPVSGIPNVTLIPPVFDSIASLPCFATIEMGEVAFNETTREVSGTVSGSIGSNLDAANGRLMVYVVEDSIMMPQTDYTLLGDNTVWFYRHNNVVRRSLTGSWGVPLTIDNEGRFSHTFSGTLPAVTNVTNGGPCNVPTRTRIVAFIYHYNPADPNDCPVWNTTSSPKLHASPVAIQESAAPALYLYPNPASDYIVIDQEDNTNPAHLTITDMQGRQQLSLSLTDSRTPIALHRLSPGLYIATLTTPQGTTAKRFSIAR